MREIDAISRWIEHWLTDDEQLHVIDGTGHDFAQVFTRDLPPVPAPGPSTGDDDDDAPF